MARQRAERLRNKHFAAKAEPPAVAPAVGKRSPHEDVLDRMRRGRDFNVCGQRPTERVDIRGCGTNQLPWKRPMKAEDAHELMTDLLWLDELPQAVALPVSQVLGR